MIHKFPNRETQLQRAKLILPFFQSLRGNKKFLTDVENLRIQYGIIKSWDAKHKISPLLLRQDCWYKDKEWMGIVLSFSEELRETWERFHRDIEELSEKFRLKHFPYLVKDFILTGRFWNLFFRYWFKWWTDWFDIKLSYSIKKTEFEKIWMEIQKFRKEYPQKQKFERTYSDEVLQKYQYTDKANHKYFADQMDIHMLIEKEINWTSDIMIEKKIEGWERPKRSRLKRITREILSLLDDLNDAKF